MVLVIGFMTAIMIYRKCDDDYNKCNGEIDCSWLSPHDGANCSQQCSVLWSIPCDCNKPGNMTCEGSGWVCYGESCKFIILFYLVNVIMINCLKVSIVVKLNKVDFVLKDCLIM